MGLRCLGLGYRIRLRGNIFLRSGGDCDDAGNGGEGTSGAVKFDRGCLGWELGLWEWV